MSSDSRAAATDTPRTGEPTPAESAGIDQRGPLNLEKLRQVATKQSAGLRIIDGAEWRVFYDNYEKGTLFVGHISKSSGLDIQARGIREGAVAEFIAAFNPRTVNALLDLIEAQEAQLAEYRRREDLAEGINNVTKTHYEELLEAQLAEITEGASKVLEAVDYQANDDGLWFDAATAPEAYLQQELRLLHALIEKRLAATLSTSPDKEERKLQSNCPFCGAREGGWHKESCRLTSDSSDQPNREET